MLDAGVGLRDVQIAARHADPRTTMRYDRARKNLDRHPNYILAAYMASGTWIAQPPNARNCRKEDGDKRHDYRTSSPMSHEHRTLWVVKPKRRAVMDWGPAHRVW
jgi:hypothetical protein